MKLYPIVNIQTYAESHPTWVRGLKPNCRVAKLLPRFVAPYVGAWIETCMILDLLLCLESHPTWVRGLKHYLLVLIYGELVSHPTWVRGLKLLAYTILSLRKEVAPYVGAWIETSRTPYSAAICRSHPTWVRGLKLRVKPKTMGPKVSHPTWVRGLKHRMGSCCREIQRVAPYVGAWIETPQLYSD